MALIVQKFGGTSVADPRRILESARHTLRERNAGHQVVVVVSAMAGVTNQLVQYTNEMGFTNPREQDVILASGEQVTIGLMAMALQKLGIQSSSHTGWQIPIETDHHHTRARVKKINTGMLKSLLDNGITPVIPGFQGVTSSGEITTLGRGGSDTTAVALAAALKADWCDIYTDVDGVYTADPRVVPNAKKIDDITYEEMLELASLGAKVLHMRSVMIAMINALPLRVLSSFKDVEANSGTWIRKNAYGRS